MFARRIMPVLGALGLLVVLTANAWAQEIGVVPVGSGLQIIIPLGFLVVAIWSLALLFWPLRQAVSDFRKHVEDDHVAMQGTLDKPGILTTLGLLTDKIERIGERLESHCADPNHHK